MNEVERVNSGFYLSTCLEYRHENTAERAISIALLCLRPYDGSDDLRWAKLLRYRYSRHSVGMAAVDRCPGTLNA